MDEHMNHGPHDVVVVGGGLAGLTAAATAAGAGCTVVVVDGRSPGGRARSTERDGFLLNEGAHALYTAGRGAEILAGLGVAFHGGPPALKGTHTWWDGRRRAMPVGAASLATSRLLGWRAKAAAASLWGVFGAGRAEDATGLSVAEWLDRRRVPADLQRFVGVLARTATYCADLDRLAAPAAIAQMSLAQRGVLYLDDGWQTLVDGLRRVAEGLGTCVVADEVVTGLVADGDVWAVVTPERTLVARHVVLAAGGPEQAVRLAGRDPGWTDGAGPSVHAACLDIGASVPPEVPLLLSADAPLYLSQHTPAAARLASDGATLVHALRYLRVGEQLAPTAARAELDEHTTRAGLPRERRVMERFLHRMTVAHGLPIADRRRPRGDELAADGLFAAGDWVSDEMLADAAIASGAAAARAIVGRRVAGDR
jgi:phytoene dehydrogenase-like protein